MLAIKEKFYREILFEDRKKHHSIYKTWFNEDEKSRKYIASRGKCYKYVAYNHTLSEEISLNRDIWDMRHKDCAEEYKDLDILLQMITYLFQTSFVHESTGARVTREQFMMVLAGVEALHIRASYYTIVTKVS